MPRTITSKYLRCSTEPDDTHDEQPNRAARRAKDGRHTKHGTGGSPDSETPHQRSHPAAVAPARVGAGSESHYGGDTAPRFRSLSLCMAVGYSLQSWPCHTRRLTTTWTIDTGHGHTATYRSSEN